MISSERLIIDGVELTIDRSTQQVLPRAEVVVDIAPVYASATGLGITHLGKDQAIDDRRDVTA